MGRVADESFIILEPGFKRISETGKVDDDGVIYLAQAVLQQACYDLKASSRWLKDHALDGGKKKEEVIKLRQEVERFFRGRWFKQFVDCDGGKIVAMLRGQSPELHKFV